MRVIRYVNGKKVEETSTTPAPSSPAVVPPAPKRVIKKVTSAPPSQSPPAQPNKGCGCGR